LTSLIVNFEWRKIIASALSFYWQEYESELGLDNEDLRNNLLVDLYNMEVQNVAIERRFQVVDIVSLRSTSAGSPTLVTGSDFLHTFTKPNVLVRCSNVSVAMNANGNIGHIRAVVGGVQPLSPAEGIMKVTDVRTLMCASFYGSMTAGSKQVALYFYREAGTINVHQTTQLLFEILEWDD